MKYKVVLLLFCLTFGFAANLFATHIAGGYLSYECLGLNSNNTVSYRVQVYYYRDCFSGNPDAREDSLNVTVFSPSGVVVNVVELQSISFRELTLNEDFNLDCLVEPTNICYEEEVYEAVIDLSPSRSHTLSYQRCCRNAAVTNLLLSGNQGATYTAEIPAFNSVGCNSTPFFGEPPPTIFCVNDTLDLDLSAIDVDGDSLAYTLCAPYNYSGSNVWPFQANPPPYSTVNYASNYNPFFPLESNPPLQVGVNTGLLSGLPDSLGLYVIGFCVEEYRNNILLNVTRRDIQVNTIDCTPVAEAIIQNQNVGNINSSKAFCQGLKLNFTNLSKIETPTETYKWDFGDPATLGDTSRSINTSYEYVVPGQYTVSLIANPGTECADTIQEDFFAYPKLNPTLEYFGENCLDENSFSFFAAGEKEDYANYQWNFFGNAVVNQSTADTLYNQSFTQSGNFPVQLVVEQDICTDTLVRNVSVYENPTAGISFDPDTGCFPQDIQFASTSTIAGNADYLWNFGDGNSSTQENPLHTYLENGLFDVSFQLTTTDKCIDTVSLTVKDAIHISPQFSPNRIGFTYGPNEACAPGEVQFTDTSSFLGKGDYYWDFGDGTISNEVNPTHVYQDTGSYFISLMIITSEKCAETLLDSMPDAIRILPKPKAAFSISDSALPLKEAQFSFKDESVDPSYRSTFWVQNQVFPNTDLLNYAFQDTGHFTIQQVVENQFECKDTSYKEVFVFDVFELNIPNVFTPNNDGINDDFLIEACGIYEFDLKVFNRNGNKVFESERIANSWDGRINGKKANSGVYYYQLKLLDFRGQYLNYQGVVSVLAD
ncbi:MAG: PKD domain-containing protein [Vicingaceae bacterium]